MRRALVVLLAATVAWPFGPVPAQTQETALFSSIEIVPLDGTTLTWRDRQYAGGLIIEAFSDGLAVTEKVAPEEYLLGIQEVPFSWHIESLRAQAVAARTYLAWTLRRGRAGAGATYGFDICASDQCQVYGGLNQVEGPGGDRWLEAVSSTVGEMLLANGVPAQALYSSTSGGRTRAVEDVFGGSPISYLQAVSSPNEESPFADWEVRFDVFQLREILAQAGVLQGSFRDIGVVQTPDGEGPWVVKIEGRVGEQLDTWEFRSLMNRWAPRVYPDDFPGPRPDGGTYPQTILSPTYTIDYEIVFPNGEPDAEWLGFEWVVTGNGWGHLVGMSQYGAKAMADAGASYDEILSHFYSGLRPEQVDLLPDEIEVGLGWGLEDVVIGADGPYTVEADGRVLVAEGLGSWSFTRSSGLVAAVPPIGIGLPPILIISGPAVADSGRAVAFTGRVSAPAEVRAVIFRGAEVVGSTDWRVREAGELVDIWDASMRGEEAPPGRYRVMFQARSAAGTDHEFATLELIP